MTRLESEQMIESHETFARVWLALLALPVAVKMPPQLMTTCNVYGSDLVGNFCLKESEDYEHSYFDDMI